MNTVNEIVINDYYVRLVKSTYTGTGGAIESTEPCKVDAIIKTEDFMKNFNYKMNLDSGLIPNNCKFIKTLPNYNKIYILEDEPRIRTISFNYDPSVQLEILKQNGKYDSYNLSQFNITNPFTLSLSIPYVVYVIKVSPNLSASLSLFFRLTPITSLNDYLLEPCLPNISESYEVCLGNYKGMNGRIVDVDTLIKKVIDAFWFNSFNLDYSCHVNNYGEIPELSDLFTYAYNSKIDPMFIFSTNWFNTGSSLNDVINKYRNTSSRPDEIGFDQIFNYFQHSIQKSNEESNEENIVKYRTLKPNSIATSNNFILSVGDEILEDNKKWYIDSFNYNDYDELKSISVESELNEVKEIAITDEFLLRIKQQFGNKQLESIKIGDRTFTVGEHVYFKNTTKIKSIEKIITTRDNLKHIKIGYEFYLESSFLTNNICKFDDVNIEFGGMTLVKEKEYVLIKIYGNNEYFCSSYFKAIFKGFESVNGDMRIKFYNTKTEKDSYYSIDDKDNFKLFEPEALIPIPDIFRVNNQIITKDVDLDICYIDKHGFYCVPGQRSNLLRCSCAYDPNLAQDYFTNFCKSEEKELKIKSFDFDLNYTIGDCVIHIDWDFPEEMLKIQTITEFNVYNNHFYLKLTDENGNSKDVGLIDLKTGEGKFESIRHVCNQINEIKVGMKMKPNNKEVPDFSMRNVYEIKAFVIDSSSPLVLFSNGRTLYFEIMMKNFIIVDPSHKKYSIPEGINTKIKKQNGDKFSYYNELIQLVSQEVSTKYDIFNLSLSGYNTFKIRYTTPDINRELKKLSNRRGLLTPRFHKDLNVEYINGYPTIFSDALKTEPWLPFKIMTQTLIQNPSE